jgi:hypothetical protein
MPFDQAEFGRKLSAYDRRCLAVFKQAYAKLNEGPHQWCKGRLVNATDAHCAIGWLRMYASPTQVNLMVVRHIKDLDILPGRSATSWLMHFNDTHEYDDVLNLFSRTIDRLEFG